MSAQLAKLHGLGNDYLVADPADLPFALTPERVRLICHRHFGVGSDGLLVLGAVRGPLEFELRILNPDGSEAEKSGNGVRIFARWLFDRGLARARRFRIHTPGGTVPVEVEVDAGRVAAVTADMGVPEFRGDLEELEVGGSRLRIVAVSTGNPHCVVPRDALEREELLRLGPAIERHPAFPARTNVQLARVQNRRRVEALVWERGAGETLASGSSACAVAAAFQRLGLLDDEVDVAMPGGELRIRRDGSGSLWMRGPVEEVATVTLSADLLARLEALPAGS